MGRKIIEEEGFDQTVEKSGETGRRVAGKRMIGLGRNVAPSGGGGR
jgi:hypothetical protein